MSDRLEFSYEHPVVGKDLLPGSGALDRLTWLRKRISEDGWYFLQDGEISLLLFQEMATSFVNGQFIAATLLGFSFIEKSIAGRLFHEGDRSLLRANADELFEAAFAKGWLREGGREALDRLRPLRRPIVHYREPSHRERLEKRANDEAKTLSVLTEEDAKLVVDTAIQFILDRTAF